MLFNSYPFMFLFLPITLAGFFGLARLDRRLAAAWLVLASLFFYGWWNPRYLALLGGSIVFNHLMGLSIARALNAQARRRLLIVGIVGDLSLLAYYKYADFLLSSIGILAHRDLGRIGVVLPLGISFFTFTQIAFLVDVSRGIATEVNPIHYGLFVTYFPHLIAGPVLHHKEMMPQFDRPTTYRPRANELASGLSMFVIGLFKKVIIADLCGPWAASVFDLSPAKDLSLIAAWSGAVAYSLQIYFDFSGYTDMAIGISRLFGIELPLNFNSPYQAESIVDFWRRWHMTLSRFLRDYLYIPLGGNRQGPVRRHLNLMLTMLLGGLWHGAGWTFVIWGGLHGAYLIVNHVWHGASRGSRTDQAPRSRLLGRIFSRLLTFAAVTVAWVFFRATDLSRACAVLRGLFGWNGIALPAKWQGRLPGVGVLTRLGVRFDQAPLVEGSRLFPLALLFAFVLLAPNSQQVMQRWRPNMLWLILILLMAAVAIGNIGAHVSEFLYYRF